MVVEMEHGMGPRAVADGAVAYLDRAMQASGGVIVLGREGSPAAAFNTAAMPFAVRE
jgi:isoaspartyl peptidase/L-asparaginase-like protein (Ntn-hydrolase superfamily)